MVRSSRRTRYLAAALVAAALFFAPCGDARAAEAPFPEAADRPAQVGLFLELLADPTVRAWLDTQRAALPARSEAAPEEETLSSVLARRGEAIRGRVGELVAAAPRLPQELSRALVRLGAELRDAPGIGLLVIAAALAGLAAEALFRRATRRLAGPLRPPETLASVGARLGLRVGVILVSAFVMLGVLLAVDWPPLVRLLLLGFVLALALERVLLALLDTLLAPARPGAETVPLRPVPMSDAAARFWFRRLALATAWFVFGWTLVDFATALGFSPEMRQVFAHLLGLGLLAIGCECAWRAPARTGAARHVRAMLLSLYFVALWTLWVLSAAGLFWLALVALALPAALRLADRTVAHLLPAQPEPAGGVLRGLRNVLVERGLRAVLIGFAVLVLARAWHVDLVALTAGDNPLTRLARGLLGAVVIVLAADLLWQLAKNAIDRVAADAASAVLGHDAESARRARLRTLLPLLRNVLFTTLIAIAAMMILSAWGVAIGPLIAGAGVVGVAIAFGAQTLVKDIVSGLFYLIDDAFRVGEYIQSGTYKGTVESFSLRSVKLRHHRGPLYTVPFGVLGAVQNMSRDWVIDKLTVSVTYDTEIERVKKIIKEIGKTLAADAEFAPHILETLKMQGIEQFGDFAVQIRMKMMTRPGEQFSIRRRAYALIKKAFDANGIRFAFPTVQVAGGAEATAAAVGKHALDLAQRPTAA
jgi:moderate conductance mechanosensitive channel